MTLADLDKKLTAGELVFMTDIDLAMAEEIHKVYSRASLLQERLRQKLRARLDEMGAERGAL